MNKNGTPKEPKHLTVEDLAEIVGARRNRETESEGGEIEGPQRRSRYPESRTRF
jgi:hypothetical protein